MSQVNVTFLPMGIKVVANTGDRITDIAHANGVDIQMACGGNAACSTCRVIVKSGQLSAKEEMETLWDLPEGERLSCQCQVQNSDIIVEVPQ